MVAADQGKVLLRSDGGLKTHSGFAAANTERAALFIKSQAGSSPTFSKRRLAKGAVLTMGAFGVTNAVRFLTNVVLARLLAPELFGIMFIVKNRTAFVTP